MRFSIVSMVPNNIVQLIGNPIECAVSCIDRYSSEDSFPCDSSLLHHHPIFLHPRLGKEPKPEFFSLESVSKIEIPEMLEMCFISTAVNALIWILGNSCLTL